MSREEFEQASTRVGHAEGRELGADGAGQLATARGPGGGARGVLVRGLIRGQAAPAGADQPHVETRLAAKQLEDRAVAFAARQVLEELTQPGELQANRSHLGVGVLEDALAVADREGARGSRLLHPLARVRVSEPQAVGEQQLAREHVLRGMLQIGTVDAAKRLVQLAGLDEQAQTE